MSDRQSQRARAGPGGKSKGFLQGIRRRALPLLAAALASFVIAKITGALEWAETQSWGRLFPPATLAVDVKTDPAIFDATIPVDWERYDYVIPRPLNELPAPPAGTCRERHRWARALDGVDARRTKVRVYLRGLAEDGIVVDGARAIIDSRKAPLSGTHAACFVGGAQANPIALFLYLDSRNPHIHYGRSDEAKRPFLLTISKGEIVPLELIAYAERSDVRWWLELAVQAGDSTRWRRVDDHGQAFRTTGIRRAIPATYFGDRWKRDPTARE